jgi:hypothetical protein
MSLHKTTVITHIFNEEYLLPFWIEHHKKIFDELIVIDYRSTDKSIEICKSNWPSCKIVTTRNECFAAEEIDKEVMDIENDIEGIKMALNTTEFLFCEIPIKELFSDNKNPTSYAVNAVSPYSKKNYTINDTYELFNNLLNDDVVYHNDRGVRQIHNYPNGKYDFGRHRTYNYSIPETKLHIIWLGFYPMNEKLLERKMQIQQNIPQRDKNCGFGFQHLYDKNKILSVNNEKSSCGISLKTINATLCNLVTSMYTR